MEPEYPYDSEELKHIERLMDKIPVYKAKITELSKQIEALSRQATKASMFSDSQMIYQLIHKVFYIEVENRPFNCSESEYISRLKAEIAWHGEIKNRNIPCEVCGENRSVDRCHIVPSKHGGTQDTNNLLFLCPTHHRLLDRFMLSKAEWAIIDWERKSTPSQQYATSVIFEAHKIFWTKLERHDFANIEPYHVNEKAFARHVVDSIGQLFIPGRLVDRSSIDNILDINIREISTKIIDKLISAGVFKQIKRGGKPMLILASRMFQVSDDLMLRIWSDIS